MNLLEAIEYLDNYDFQGLDPEALTAISLVLLAAKTRARATEVDRENRVVETTVD